MFFHQESLMPLMTYVLPSRKSNAAHDIVFVSRSVCTKNMWVLKRTDVVEEKPCSSKKKREPDDSISEELTEKQ